MRFSSACGCLMVSVIGVCSSSALRMSIQSAWFIRSAEGNQGQRLSPRFAWGESLLAVDPKGTKRSCAHDLAGLRPVPGVAPVGTGGHALTPFATLRSDRHAHKDSVPPCAPPASVQGTKGRGRAITTLGPTETSAARLRMILLALSPGRRREAQGQAEKAVSPV